VLIDKIDKASQKSKQSRLKVAAVLLCAAVLIPLFILDVFTVDFSRFKKTPSQERSKLSAPANGLNEQVSPAESPGLSSAIEGNMPSQSLSNETISEPSQIPNAAGQTKKEEDDKLRERVKEALAEFDEKYLPSVKALGFDAWNPGAKKEILAERDKAASQFAQAEYNAALSELKKSEDRAKRELKAYAAAFEKEFKSAQAFYIANDYEAAKWRIDAALKLQPENAGAMRLKSKIDGLPAVLKLIEAATIARVENNLAAEAKHLEELIKLDPNRAEHKSRLVEVKKSLREEAFAKHIQNGLEHVENQNLKKAREQLSAAKKLYKTRTELDYLNDQVVRLGRDLKVEKFITDARAAARSDDWVKAEARYAEAGKLVPDKQEVVQGRKLARQIIDATNEVTNHLSSPNRLSSLNVAKLVEGLLKSTRDIQTFSTSLAAKAKQLSNLLDDYSQPIPVRVISDGKTFVSVRGVGQVGKVKQKEIKLRPGKYVFEGERAGYKNKSVEITIEPSSFLSKVQVYCDEPI